MTVAYYLNRMGDPHSYRALTRMTNPDLKVHSIPEAIKKGWEWEPEEYYYWDALIDHFLTGAPEPKLEIKLIWPQKQ